MSRPTNCSHRLHGVDCVEWCEESFGAAARCYANAEAAELLIPFMVADVRGLVVGLQVGLVLLVDGAELTSPGCLLLLRCAGKIQMTITKTLGIE